MFVERGAAYRRGGGRSYYWACRLACGHGRTISTASGKQPSGVRKCYVCEHPDDTWAKRSSDRALGLVASLEADAVSAPHSAEQAPK